MSATKILWGQILIVFAIVLATVWGATQWTAWRLGYQPQLGLPWFWLYALGQRERGAKRLSLWKAVARSRWHRPR
jgi:type IV secretory pathway TraG/TraD family ATPase VirD4